MDQEALVAAAKEIAAGRITPEMGVMEKVDVLETAMMELLDVQVMTPAVGRVATLVAGGFLAEPGRWLMGNEPRLPKMPEAPGLMDFFRCRFLLDRRGGSHLLQSAKLARKNGLSDEIVLACLLHDISVIALIRTDHGHWSAQLVEPYVPEETAWAIRHHQSLRFLPDSEVGYEYPKSYMTFFGEDYDPPDYIKREWDYCRNHRWYMSARQVTMNDLYAFDPDAEVALEEFEDVIGRTFKQPDQGLGFDNSPVAHMWRTLIWPNNFLLGPLAAARRMAAMPFETHPSGAPQGEGIV